MAMRRLQVVAASKALRMLTHAYIFFVGNCLRSEPKITGYY